MKKKKKKKKIIIGAAVVLVVLELILGRITPTSLVFLVLSICACEDG